MLMLPEHKVKTMKLRALLIFFAVLLNYPADGMIDGIITFKAVVINLEELLSFKTDKDSGYTALMARVEAHDLEKVKETLETEKETINSLNNDKESALTIAAINAPIPIIKALLAAGAAIDHQNSHGDSALMIASKIDTSGKIVACLLKHKASPVLIDADGNNALTIALKWNNYHNILALIAYEVSLQPNKLDESMLSMYAKTLATINNPLAALKIGNENMFKLSIKKVSPMLKNRQGQTILHHAIRLKKYPEALYILSFCPNAISIADDNDKTPIDYVFMTSSNIFTELVFFFIIAYIV